MTFNIQIGKTYITNIFDPEEPNDNDIVTIVGRVYPETIEYQLGFRFVAHNGELYTRDGKCKDIHAVFEGNGLSYINETKPTSPFNIVRTALSQDLKIATEEYARMSLEDCEKSDKFIKNDDPKFFMGLGQTYVDRRGMLKFVNKVYRFNDTQLWGPDGGARFISNDEGYEPNGKENSGRLSMYDIIYQKIG